MPQKTNQSSALSTRGTVDREDPFFAGPVS